MNCLPFPVGELLSDLHDTPTLVRTALAEPPIPRHGGPGYWPGPDPFKRADIHARETLEEYRRWEA